MTSPPTEPPKPPPSSPNVEVLDSIEAASARILAAQTALKEVIYGQDTVILHCMTALLAGGHILLIGLPGLAKTRLVSCLSKVLGLDTRRVQCTPDLMPSDIIGAEVLEEVDYGRRNFRFIQGPVFCQILMVDEINRTSPRTQSALLQAMQERQVTVMGREHTLPKPFHVLATQNPLEQEGIYPLPEAQLDRFMLQIDIGYPDAETEKRILQKTLLPAEPVARTIMYANDLLDIQNIVRQMAFSDALQEVVLAIVRNGRPETTKLDIVKKYVSWGPSPRASQSFALAARAYALLDGRLAPADSDILALAKPVLQHRMALNFAARADGVRMDDIIRAIVQSVAKG